MFIYKFKTIYLSIIILFIIIFSFVVPQSVNGQAGDQFCSIVEETLPDVEGYQKAELSQLQLNWPSVGSRDLNQVEGTALSDIFDYLFWLSIWLSVVIAFLTIVYIGFSYYGAKGSPKKSLELRQRLKNVFLGLLILLFAVSILRFINPDNQERVDKIKEVGEQSAEYVKTIELPNDAGFGSKIRDVSDHLYFPIPFTNQYGSQREYSRLISYIQGKDGCNKCGNYDVNNSACTFFCDEKSISTQNIQNVDTYLYGGYDTLKNSLECKVYESAEIRSYAMAKDDDDTPVSCTAACIAIARHKIGVSHTQCSGSEYDNDKNEDFIDWVNNKSKIYLDNATFKSNAGIYDNFYMFGKSGSLKNGHLEKATGSLRECIAEHYVYEAQQFPIADQDIDVCLCRV